MIPAEPNLIKCARTLRTFHVNLFETKQHGNEPCGRVSVIFFPRKSLIPLYHRVYRAYSNDNGKKQRLGVILFIVIACTLRMIDTGGSSKEKVENYSSYSLSFRINDKRKQRKRKRPSGLSTYAVKKSVNNRQLKRNS